MRRVPLSDSDVTVPNVVLGLMRIQDKTDEEIRTLVGTALDNGIDFFDHADVYGTPEHGCERRFAEAMRLSPAQRAEIVLQTKCGIVRSGPYFDFSAQHILESVDGSLDALGTGGAMTRGTIERQRAIGALGLTPPEGLSAKISAVTPAKAGIVGDNREETPAFAGMTTR